MPSAAIIPELPEFLTLGGSCIVFCPHDVRILAWARTNEGQFYAQIDDEFGARKVYLSIDVWNEERVHFHVERSRQGESNWPGREVVADEIVKKFTNFVEMAGTVPVCIKSISRLLVRDADLPKSSLVAGLLRTKGVACRVPYSLKSAELALDDELFTTIGIKRRSDEHIEIEICFATEDCPRPGYLETADETAKIGADCFVFERIMPVSSHAVRS